MHYRKKSSCISAVVLVLLCIYTPICFAKKPAQALTSPPRVDNVPLPNSVSLCGEAVPLERQAVRERLDREFTIIVWDRPQIFLWLKRANRYFPFIEQELKKAGLPDDLKYLAVAESSLLTHARSPAGASGYWQFMPKTATEKGLKKDSFRDERYSLEHSTAAALTYLKQCYDIFGSWPLAMAAYNCGERRVRQAIEQQKVTDYYQLKLPTETERYVFRIAAIKILLENHESYGYRISPTELYPPAVYDMVDLTIRYKLHIPDLAIAAGTDYKTIRQLNPQFKKYYFPRGTYMVKVPRGLKKKFLKQIAHFSSEAEKRARARKTYKVKRGDTLSHIAERTGISVGKLKELNGLKSSTIRPGQKLQLQP